MRELFPNETVKLKPFVKWAGGKRQIVKELVSRAPEGFNRYFEPFLGGGALLFELQPETAIVSDINYDLINAYRVVRDKVDELIALLRFHEKNHCKDYYYKIRGLNKDLLSDVERAARFIYLNKTCYNGLYRENSRGEFNVPIGRYKNPNVCDEDNLRAISEYLSSASVTIVHGDYKKIVSTAAEGDFIYFDPPYVPVSTTSNFTKYTKYDFDLKDQKDLAGVFKELSNRGCYVMLSNSDTELVYELYRDFNIEKVKASRYINCKSYKRKNHAELIIRNYGQQG